MNLRAHGSRHSQRSTMPSADMSKRTRPIAPAFFDTDAILSLTEGWHAARCAPDQHLTPPSLDDLEWLPATVPGTAAAALQAAGLWRPGCSSDLDATDWWFRTSFHATPPAGREQVTLEFEGIATVAEVFLNGAKLLRAESMFAAHAIDVDDLLRGENELAIRCCALTPLLHRRRTPRARWRQRLVNGNLRFFRTMLLGRAPGFAPGPAAVGPWRPVRLTRRCVASIEQLKLRARIDDQDDACGELSVQAVLQMLDGDPIESVDVELSGPSGVHRAALELDHFPWRPDICSGSTAYSWRCAMVAAHPRRRSPARGPPACELHATSRDRKPRTRGLSKPRGRTAGARRHGRWPRPSHKQRAHLRPRSGVDASRSSRSCAKPGQAQSDTRACARRRHEHAPHPRHKCLREPNFL